jgi:hypothetical protein
MYNKVVARNDFIALARDKLEEGEERKIAIVRKSHPHSTHKRDDARFSKDRAAIISSLPVALKHIKHIVKIRTRSVICRHYYGWVARLHQVRRQTSAT